MSGVLTPLLCISAPNQIEDLEAYLTACGRSFPIGEAKGATRQVDNIAHRESL